MSVGRQHLRTGASRGRLRYACEMLEPRAYLNAPGTSWTPIFIDEFNGGSLDASKWSMYLPWSNSVSGDNRYHDASGNYLSYMMPDDVSFPGDGTIKFTTQKRDVQSTNGTTFHYTEGMITTANRFTQAYGYFEIRAKLPTGAGNWPAFWMTNGWPPEDDIMEYWPAQPRFHQGLYGMDSTWHDTNDTSGFPSSNWHTYSMEWGPGYQKFFVDGTQKFSTITTGVPGTGNPQYMLLNSGVQNGQTGSYSNSNNNALLVDYVRVYGYNASAGPTIANPGWNTTGSWSFTNSNAFVVTGGTIGRTGTGDLHIEGSGEANQTITGLSRNTTYTFSAYGAIGTGSTQGQIGVRNYGGSELTSPIGTVSTWTPGAVTFTTGAGVTSATVFLRNVNSNFVYFDDTNLSRSPTLATITDRSTPQNVNANVPVSVLNAPSASGAVSVSATSSDQSIFANAGITASGSGASWTLNLTPMPNAVGSATITVTVTDVFGSRYSTPFVLNVTPTNSVSGDQDFANEPDTFRVVRSGSDVQVFRNNAGATPDFTFDYATASQIVIAGLGGDDTLVLDYSGGDPVAPGGLYWSGGPNGAGGDTVSVVGSAGNDTVTLASSGNISIAGGNALQVSTNEAAQFDLAGGFNTLSAPSPTTSYAITLVVQPGSTLTLASSISLPSSTDATVDGTLNLNGQSFSLDALTGNGSVTVGGGTLTLGAAGASSTFSGAIAGGGGVTKTGAGTFTLAGSSSYTGATNVSAGVLVAAAATGALGSISGNTTVATGAALWLQGGVTVGDALALSGAASALDVRLRNVSGSNTITGAITLTTGGTEYVFQSDSGSALALAGTVVSSGGGTRNLYLAGAGSGAMNSTVGNVVGTTLNLIKNDSGTWTLAGNNAYAGVTTINAGALRAASANALGATGSSSDTFIPGNNQSGRLELIGGVTFAAETLSLNARTAGSNPTVSLLNVGGNNTWTGPINLQVGGQDYRFQSDAGKLTITGAITNITASSSQRSIYLQGAGDGQISGVVSNNASTTGPITVTMSGTGTWTLAGSNTYFGGTSVSSGTLRVAHDAALGIGALNISGSGLVVLNSGLLRAVKLSALSIAQATGSTLDVTDNDLIVGGATSKAMIESLVASARASGMWIGGGISSSTARDNAAANTGLGVLSGAEYSSVGGAGTFAGQSYGASDTLVKYTYNGDANFSGTVTFDDYVKIDTGFNTGLTGWLNGDFNFSGSVNFDDYVLIDVAFNSQGSPLNRIAPRRQSGSAAPPSRRL